MSLEAPTRHRFKHALRRVAQLADAEQPVLLVGERRARRLLTELLDVLRGERGLRVLDARRPIEPALLRAPGLLDGEGTLVIEAFDELELPLQDALARRLQRGRPQGGRARLVLTADRSLIDLRREGRVSPDLARLLRCSTVLLPAPVLRALPVGPVLRAWPVGPVLFALPLPPGPVLRALPAGTPRGRRAAPARDPVAALLPGWLAYTRPWFTEEGLYAAVVAVTCYAALALGAIAWLGR